MIKRVTKRNKPVIPFFTWISETSFKYVSRFVDNADHRFPTNVFHPFAKKTYVKVPKTNHN